MRQEDDRIKGPGPGPGPTKLSNYIILLPSLLHFDAPACLRHAAAVLAVELPVLLELLGLLGGELLLGPASDGGAAATFRAASKHSGSGTPRFLAAHSVLRATTDFLYLETSSVVEQSLKVSGFVATSKARGEGGVEGLTCCTPTGLSAVVVASAPVLSSAAFLGVSDFVATLAREGDVVERLTGCTATEVVSAVVVASASLSLTSVLPCGAGGL